MADINNYKGNDIQENEYRVGDLTWRKRPTSLLTRDKGKYRKAKLYETIEIHIDSEGHATTSK